MANAIVDVIAALLALVIEIVPGFRERWEAWPWQKAALLGACLVVSFALLIACYQGIPVGFECASPLTPAVVWAAISAALDALSRFFGVSVLFAIGRQAWRALRR